MKKNIFIIFLLITTISSCDLLNRRDLKSYLDDIGIQLQDHYQTLHLEQTGFKDFTLKAMLVISKKDRDNILKGLKKQVVFIKIDTIPNLNSTESFQEGYLNKSTYYFGKTETRGNHCQNYQLKLDTTNNHLDFEWGDY